MLSVDDALAYLADRAAEVGYTQERLKSIVDQYLSELDQVYDEYAYDRSLDWCWDDFWKAVQVGYDAKKAAKRSGSMFTNADPYDDPCRGCW